MTPEIRRDTSAMSEEDTVAAEARDADTMLAELAEDYARYLKVDFTKEKGAIEDSIEDMLTRLEEFETLLEMIHSDSCLCFEKTVPEIFSCTQSLQQMFERIDRLESFVVRVKQDLETMESHLDAAEAAVGSESSLRMVLKPLFFKKAADSQGGGKKTVKTPTYEAPRIFCTANFINPSVEGEQGVGTGSSHQ